MGADGGSIPKRIELVRTKSRPHTSETAKLSKLECWKYCALSKELLQVPVVTCKLGRLYNKESILRFLLDRKSFPEAEVSHIRSLKDVVTLNMTPNHNFKPSGTIKATEMQDLGSSSFICPVTTKEMNGNFTFVYLKGCGCVLSEQALKEITTDTCLKCGKKRKEDDVIILNPNAGGLGKKSQMSRKRSSEDPLNETETTGATSTLVADDNTEDVPYLQNERGYRPSLSGLATFRKTTAINSLYKK